MGTRKAAAVARLILLVILVIATWRVPAAAQAPAPLMGTWIFNAAKSTTGSGSPAFKRATCRIEPWEDGIRVVYDIVRNRGGVTHTEWTGRLDGRDYAVEGVDAVITNAYTRIDDRTYDVVQRVDGAAVFTVRLTISSDGKSLTMAAPGGATVYERR